MIRLKISSKPIELHCSLLIDFDVSSILNCATTGGSSGHGKYSSTDEAKLKSEFLSKLKNATIEDFNFGQLTDPDRWNKIPKGEYRTANGAFFTLLWEYNRRAKKAGKPTIGKQDIIDFIKKAATSPANIRFDVEQFSTTASNPTGNDSQPAAIIKAPIGLLLQGKDLGILGANTEDRLQNLGDETDMYIKIAFRDTLSRDANGDLTVVEEGIQPISIHRDADSKLTKPGKNKPDPHDTAWDTNEIPEKAIAQGPKRYFEDY